MGIMRLSLSVPVSSRAGDHVRSLAPGRPMNNSLAERNNLYVIDQVSTCLLAAGLPPRNRSFALTSTCHLLNVEIVDGESAWYRAIISVARVYL